MLHFKDKFSSAYRALLLITFLVFAQNSYSENTIPTHKKIGIIIPIEHEAINQITAGIKETLSSMDVEIITQNAHADPNIMLAIIKQMKDQNIDLIMPIGTSASQMTIAHIKNKPIICVASINPKSNNPLVTGVNDEIATSTSLSKLPMLKNIAVIYSSSEKIAPEIEELKKYAANNNVTLHLSMIQTLVDMPLAVRSAPDDIQAFLILKDHLIASGINILIQEAKKRSIPLLASDEGSVSKGATMAIGVRENYIGIEAASITKKILQGANPNSIPYTNINSLVVFVNEKSILNQKILIKEDISKLRMPIISFGKE